MKRILLTLALLSVPSGLLFWDRLQAQTVSTPKRVAVACAYSASPPTGTSGTFILVQCDSTGKLRVH